MNSWVRTVDAQATEEELPRGLEAVEETTDQVARHEDEGQLVVVLVVNLPERPLLRVVVLPEPWEGTRAGVLVGVLALPVVKDELGTAKGLQGVLWLRGSRRSLLLLSGSGLGLRLGSRLGGSSRLGLLLWWGILNSLLDEGDIDGSLKRGVVGNQAEPPGDVGESLAPLSVENLRLLGLHTTAI